MLHDLANDGDFVALMGSQGQTGMDTQKKNVKKRSIPEDYWLTDTMYCII